METQKDKEQDKELEALRDQLLRLQADFDNAKKRWLKLQAESQELANADLLRELLEVVDDFQRALMVNSHASHEG